MQELLIFNEQAHMAGGLNLGQLYPALPQNLAQPGTGNSVNNCGMVLGGEGGDPGSRSIGGGCGSHGGCCELAICCQSGGWTLPGELDNPCRDLCTDAECTVPEANSCHRRRCECIAHGCDGPDCASEPAAQVEAFQRCGCQRYGNLIPAKTSGCACLDPGGIGGGGDGGGGGRRANPPLTDCGNIGPNVAGPFSNREECLKAFDDAKNILSKQLYSSDEECNCQLPQFIYNALKDCSVSNPQLIPCLKLSDDSNNCRFCKDSAAAFVSPKDTKDLIWICCMNGATCPGLRDSTCTRVLTIAHECMHLHLGWTGQHEHVNGVNVHRALRDWIKCWCEPDN